MVPFRTAPRVRVPGAEQACPSLPARRRPLFATAITAAVAVAVLVPQGFRSADVEGSSAFTASDPAAWAHRTSPQTWASSSRLQQSRVARAAAPTLRRKKKGAKEKKGDKYIGTVNPKLRALVNSKEYRKLVEILKKLEDAGQLEVFLKNAEDYWNNLNVFNLVAEEQQSGGRGIIRTVRREWPRIWPERMEEMRMDAFEIFTAFWLKLGQSKIMDTIIGDVLPGLRQGYDEMMSSTDQQALMSLTDEQRSEEILSRLGKSEVIAQYGVLSKGDPEVKALAPKMGPAMARLVVMFERKLATQTESLGNLSDFAVVAGVIVFVVIILSLTGFLKNPFAEDIPAPPMSAPSAVMTQAAAQ